MTYTDIEWDYELAKVTMQVTIDAITAGAIKGIELAAANIEADVKRTSPIDQGTYRASIHASPPVVSDNDVYVEIGSAMPYACRLEWGFVGMDSLNRSYHQNERPHWRPAFDLNKETTKQIIAAEIRKEKGE
jgi:hypothetical protein